MHGRSADAFTLIELIIVIGIIAILGAVMVPNLLESRIVAKENAAAATLRTGILPGQTAFQSGDFADHAPPAPNTLYGLVSMGNAAALGPATPAGNGIGDFATTFDQMAGAEPADGSPATASTASLQFLPRSWAQSTQLWGGATAGGSTYLLQTGGVYAGPDIGNYIFIMGASAENVFIAVCAPDDGGSGIGRQMFAINQRGMVISTPPRPTNLLPAPNAGPFGTTYPFDVLGAGWQARP